MIDQPNTTDPVAAGGERHALNPAKDAAPQTTDWDLVMSIRGGFPENCDFCQRPYEGSRYPVPEEAGAWACNECVARWDARSAG